MSEAERIHKESLERNSKTSSRGFVLLEKVNENLESLLKAFEGRISKETVLPNSLQEYPNPIEESHRLAKHMKLIRDTQTQWEAPPIAIKRDLQKRDMLETIEENQSLQMKQNEQIVPNSETDETSEEQIAFRDVNHQELWEEIREMKQERSSFERKEAPMTEVGSSIVESLEQRQLESI